MWEHERLSLVFQFVLCNQLSISRHQCFDMTHLNRKAAFALPIATPVSDQHVCIEAGSILPDIKVLSLISF